ncbi:hypothetical protein ACLB2K_024256 [Fragaria x ananassa]
MTPFREDEKRKSALGLKCGRPSVLHPPAPATARLHPRTLQQRPRPLSLLGESVLFQFPARLILFEVLGDLAGKLEKNGLAGEGKWSGTLLECSGVEARRCRRQRVENGRTLLPSQYWAEVYNVTSSQPLSQGQTLVSPSQVFELGFFSPNSSANMYVGLWHKSIFPRKIVWVANRENPLAVTDTLATLRNGSNGNLELVDGKQSSVWSTNVSVSTNGSAAVLLDRGTFVLKDGELQNT